MRSLFDRFNRTHSNLHLNGIENEDKPGQLTISISGTIETYNTNAFQDEITALIRHNETISTLVFDLFNVSYISSTAVGAFIRLMKLTKERNIDLLFVNINNKIQSVINVLGVADYIKVVTDKDTKNFPIVLLCPGCEKKIKVTHAGEYRCPHCKKDFSLNQYNTTM